MTQEWTGEERRKDALKKEFKAVVREVLKEELCAANLIDGPTHVAHHQAIAEFLALAQHAKKTVVGAFVMGILALLVLGLAVWKGNA